MCIIENVSGSIVINNLERYGRLITMFSGPANVDGVWFQQDGLTSHSNQPIWVSCMGSFDDLNGPPPNS